MSFQHQFTGRISQNGTNPLSAQRIGTFQNILLLQGPVGPFFAELHQHLRAQGMGVTQVHFNAGDQFFGPRNLTHINLTDGMAAWRRWLVVKLMTGAFDCIILFGADRPAHKAARVLAKTYGVPVIALEEGYIRPGFITLEAGGNNAASPMAGRLPPAGWAAPDTTPVNRFGHSLRWMIGYSAAYYTIRRLFSRDAQPETYHRQALLMKESRAWIRNFARWALAGRAEARLCHRLITQHNGRYFLVPLQVAADSNMADAALGWCSARLIKDSLHSFARHAPSDCQLVFKIHPMERGHNRLTPEIYRQARVLGLEKRVFVIETGSLGELARHAAGMITINSSSGLSAIHHGTPLMVIGRALYAHPRLAHCANGKPDFDNFWTSQFQADAALRTRYLAWLREKTLRPGDFYAPRGRAAACIAVATALGNVVVDTPARWINAKAEVALGR